MTRAEAARLGGFARAAALTPERRRQIAAAAGQVGGRAILRKYGRDHLRDLGRARFAALVKYRFDGDRKAAGEWLAKAGLKSQDPAPWNGAWTEAPKAIEVLGLILGVIDEEVA